MAQPQGLVNCQSCDLMIMQLYAKKIEITVCSDSWWLDRYAWKRKANCQTVHRTGKSDASADRQPVSNAERRGQPWSCAAADRNSRLPRWLTESAPVAFCYISRIAFPQSRSSQQANLKGWNKGKNKNAYINLMKSKLAWPSNNCKCGHWLSKISLKMQQILATTQHT